MFHSRISYLEKEYVFLLKNHNTENIEEKQIIQDTLVNDDQNKIGVVSTVNEKDQEKQDTFVSDDYSAQNKIDENNQSLTITKRLENVFPQIWTPDGPGFFNLAINEIIIDWELIN